MEPAGRLQQPKMFRVRIGDSGRRCPAARKAALRLAAGLSLAAAVPGAASARTRRACRCCPAPTGDPLRIDLVERSDPAAQRERDSGRRVPPDRRRGGRAPSGAAGGDRRRRRGRSRAGRSARGPVPLGRPDDRLLQVDRARVLQRSRQHHRALAARASHRRAAQHPPDRARLRRHLEAHRRRRGPASRGDGASRIGRRPGGAEHDRQLVRRRRLSGAGRGQRGVRRGAGLVPRGDQRADPPGRLGRRRPGADRELHRPRPTRAWPSSAAPRRRPRRASPNSPARRRSRSSRARRGSASSRSAGTRRCSTRARRPTCAPPRPARKRRGRTIAPRKATSSRWSPPESTAAAMACSRASRTTTSARASRCATASSAEPSRGSRRSAPRARAAEARAAARPGRSRAQRLDRLVGCPGARGAARRAARELYRQPAHARCPGRALPRRARDDRSTCSRPTKSYFETAVAYVLAMSELDAARYVLLSRTGKLLDALEIEPRPAKGRNDDRQSGARSAASASPPG